jgi:hypothetical protein
MGSGIVIWPPRNDRLSRLRRARRAELWGVALGLLCVLFALAYFAVGLARADGDRFRVGAAANWGEARPRVGRALAAPTVRPEIR